MKYKLHTTLNTILKHDPCADGLARLKEHLNKNNIGPDDHVNLLRILKSNGVRHCIWALRACLEYGPMCKVATYISAKAAERAKEYAYAARAAANAAANAAYTANAAANDAAYAAYAAADAVYTAHAAYAASAAANDATDAAANAAYSDAYAADVDAYAVYTDYAAIAAANAAHAAITAATAADADATIEWEKQKQDLLDILEDD